MTVWRTFSLLGGGPRGEVLRGETDGKQMFSAKGPALCSGGAKTLIWNPQTCGDLRLSLFCFRSGGDSEVGKCGVTAFLLLCVHSMPAAPHVGPFCFLGLLVMNSWAADGLSGTLD